MAKTALKNKAAAKPKFKVRAYPVVDEEGKISGIVTASNIVEELSVMLDSIVRAVKSSKTREIAQRP